MSFDLLISVDSASQISFDLLISVELASQINFDLLIWANCFFVWVDSTSQKLYCFFIWVDLVN
jgi:hypothetical protein